MFRGKICKDIVGDACGMKERYEGIEGLKAYAIIGIALMHILENGDFGLTGFLFQKLIPSFTNLVFLFMMSAVLACAVGTTKNSKNRKSVWESFTPRDTVKSGPTSPYFVRLIL